MKSIESARQIGWNVKEMMKIGIKIARVVVVAVASSQAGSGRQ